jgi:hypothetical protein
MKIKIVRSIIKYGRNDFIIWRNIFSLKQQQKIVTIWLSLSRLSKGCLSSVQEQHSSLDTPLFNQINQPLGGLGANACGFSYLKQGLDCSVMLVKGQGWTLEGPG